MGITKNGTNRFHFLLFPPSQSQSHRSSAVPKGGTAWVAIAKQQSLPKLTELRNYIPFNGDKTYNRKFYRH